MTPAPDAHADRESEPIIESPTGAPSESFASSATVPDAENLVAVVAELPTRKQSRENPPVPAVHGQQKRRRWLAVFAVLLPLAVVVVVLSRVLLSTSFMRDFLQSYPGEYELPSSASSGIPAWVGWQHYFNVFLMILMIRTGLSIRAGTRTTIFWTAKRPGSAKISLTLWFHQALDLLWMVNGVIFVVLLFATGHWVRLVPTSWEVFPNAISALLQYLSFNWPTENGWVNYNSLQQLAYFSIVFLAAPLAAASGVRMSGWWPSKSTKLGKIFSLETARALHFPVMLYFSSFIVIHVFLVFATGMRRNLNHIYASQDTASWVGFGIFVGSVLLLAGAWFVARPLFLVHIAGLFGKVSGR